MEVYYDDELKEFENNLNEFSGHMRSLLSMVSPLQDARILEIYSDVVRETNNIILKIDVIVENAKMCRTELHKDIEFNKAYYDAYGQIHPDAEGIINEEDLVDN